MSYTTDFDKQKIEDEFLNFLRVNLNSIDTNSRVVEKTTSFTTTTTTIYELNAFAMNYVKSVTLDGDLLMFGRDYEILWRGDNKGSIQLNSTPAEDLSLVVVWGLKEGSSSFIYPDFPRNDLSDDSYPRVGFRISWVRDMAGMGSGQQSVWNNTGLLQIKIIGLSTAQANSIFTIMDNLIIQNYRSFYYIRYIDPNSADNFDNFQEDRTGKRFQILSQYNLEDKYQIV